MTAETSDLLASIAGKYLHFGQADLVAMAADPDAQAILVTHIRALAGSALTQHEDETHGLGVQVNLIDVFSAWGEREARDTAMLIDLCLGAAISQLLPFHPGMDDAYPAQVKITSKMLEDLAGTGRIVRLQPEPNAWWVRLMPDDPAAEPSNEEWGKLGWIRRHVTAFRDYHHAAVHAESPDPKHAKFHQERLRLGNNLLLMLGDAINMTDPPRQKAPGEKPPEKQIGDSALSESGSETIRDLGAERHPDSQDGLDKP